MKRVIRFVAILSMFSLSFAGCADKSTTTTETKVSTPGGTTTVTEETEVKTTGENPPPAQR